MNEEEMNESRSGGSAGVFRDMGVLDLRFAKTPEDLKHVRKIQDIGVVLICEEAASALTEISVHDVGSVVTIPSNVKVNCMTGQVKLSGEALAGGDPETILVLVGQTMIMGDVSSVGYKEIRVIGQTFAPRGSQAVLSPKLAQVTGQIFYTPDKFRLILGSDRFTQEFLELLPEPTAFVILGMVTFDHDVTKEIVQQKITEIALMGSIKAPAHLINLLNVLTPEKLGEISSI